MACLRTMQALVKTSGNQVKLLNFLKQLNLLNLLKITQLAQIYSIGSKLLHCGFGRLVVKRKKSLKKEKRKTIKLGFLRQAKSQRLFN